MIVAVQYYEGDLEEAMGLARLMADVEPRRRTDVLLALVAQPGTPHTGLVARTLAHCARVFPVEEVVSSLGAAGHPEGCTALWAGTVRHFLGRYREGRVGEGTGYATTFSRGDAILTLDGGDVAPLHAGWVDLTTELHEATLADGKLVTGTPYFLGTCPLHVNPNAVFQLEIFEETSLATDVPRYDGTLATNFDVYHRETMLSRARLSSFARTDWRGAGREVTAEILRDRARESIFLHGYKDRCFRWLARELMLGDPRSRPDVKHYQLPALRTQEKLRRDFEEAQR